MGCFEMGQLNYWTSFQEFLKSGFASHSMLLQLLLALAVFGTALAATNTTSTCGALSKVSTFVGSGGWGYGYGSINPGVSHPRGPLRLGPDTTTTALNVNFEHFSGYNYVDDKVRMFSHTHYAGAGIAGLGNFGMMPVSLSGRDDELSSALKRHNLREVLTKAHLWSSKFDKATETASPGAYSVYLDKPKVQVDLLATGRLSGMHRYTYTDAPTHAHAQGFVVDVCHSVHTEDEAQLNKSHCHAAELTTHADGSFSAYVLDQYDTYLYGEISATRDGKPLQGVWEVCGNGGPEDTDAGFECFSSCGSLQSTKGIMAGELRFPGPLAGGARGHLQIEVRVGLSFVSADVAKQNLQNSAAYLANSSFDQAKESTDAVWCDALSYIDIATSNAELDVALASSSYRTQLSPAIYTEYGGVYTGMDHAVHNVVEERAQYGAVAGSAEGEFYSDFSLWDTFRTQNPFLLLTDEPMFVGVLRTWGEMSQQQDAFPKWTSGSNDNGCMIGLAGASGVLEAGLAGYGQNDMDLEGMQQKLQRAATVDESKNSRGSSIVPYLQYGYVNTELNEHASSLTVTYAYDDYVLGGISALVAAASLDADTKKKVAADGVAASARASNYKNIFEPTAHVICPRAADNGPITCAKEPQRDFKHYVEGNALHWTYFVPHDIPGLMSMYGADASEAATVFESRLDTFFEEHLKWNSIYGNALPNPYFWAGNEPTMLTPYLFTYVGTAKACAKTQRWSRNAVDLHFNAKNTGVPGNDDFAAMASWLLCSSLGIYPLSGADTFFLTAPAVDRATITLKQLAPDTHAHGESVLTILVNNQAPENVYVAKLLVNGKEHLQPTIKRAVLAAGATLEFFLSAEPTTSLCPA